MYGPKHAGQLYIKHWESVLFKQVKVFAGTWIAFFRHSEAHSKSLLELPSQLSCWVLKSGWDVVWYSSLMELVFVLRN